MKDNNDVVFITLDKPRGLKLTHSVLKRFAAKKGISIDDVDEAMSTYSDLIDLIYEMLLREEPGLTEEKYEELLDLATISDIILAGRAAIEASFGTAAEGASGNPPKAAG